MALFIEIELAPEAAGDPGVMKKLVEVCPVNIFEEGADGKAEIIERNLDECTLCELCLDAAAPGAVKVIKLYDGRRALERGA